MTLDAATAAKGPEIGRGLVPVDGPFARGRFPRDRMNPSGGSVALSPVRRHGARILRQAVEELAAMPASVPMAGSARSHCSRLDGRFTEDNNVRRCRGSSTPNMPCAATAL